MRLHVTKISRPHDNIKRLLDDRWYFTCSRSILEILSLFWLLIHLLLDFVFIIIRQGLANRVVECVFLLGMCFCIGNGAFISYLLILIITFVTIYNHNHRFFVTIYLNLFITVLVLFSKTYRFIVLLVYTILFTNLSGLVCFA